MAWGQGRFGQSAWGGGSLEQPSANVLGDVSNLEARTWCEGKRIDLRWKNPEGATHVLIRRSKYAYCHYIDDPGETIYEGLAIEAFTDGVGEPGTLSSGTPLEENTFYYYTVFIRTLGDDYWKFSRDATVQGLSIRDYNSLYGDYVYKLLPRAYRMQDADPALGEDRYRLKEYCNVIQCGVNLFRGWIEGLSLLRDADRMPAGAIGVASNQTGILSAQVWDLGIQPEQSFDSGVLRRIALGIVPVYQQKGLCSGLVELFRVFAGWEAMCDEMVAAFCGVDRLFRVWDGESRIVYGSGTPDALVFNEGSCEFKLGSLSGELDDGLSFIEDAVGTVVCVESWQKDSSGNTLVELNDPAAKLRYELVGTVTGVGNTSVAFEVNPSSYPWQLPGEGPPKFGHNAWAGYTLIDSEGFQYKILSSQPTNASGITTLELSSPLSYEGNAAVAWGYGLSSSFEDRKPIARVRLFIGSFSLTYNPRHDHRLIGVNVPSGWSFLPTLGSSGPYQAHAPNDIVLWVSGVHRDLGKSTGVTSNTLSDSGKTWTPGRWKGFYVLPSWTQSTLYRILDNDADELMVEVPDGVPGLDHAAAIGSEYVILHERDAIKYSRLVTLLPSFMPDDARGFIRFNER